MYQDLGIAGSGSRVALENAPAAIGAPGTRGDGAAEVSAFSENARDLAVERPAAFRAILLQTFGDKLTPGLADDLTRAAAAGQLPMPAEVRFVDGATLGGALGAYAPGGGGTIYLNASLRNDPETLRTVVAQEMGHHLDAVLGGADTPGDEGRAFAMALDQGAPLSASQRALAAAVPDTGTIRVDGQLVAVEFALPAVLIWLGQGAAQTVPDVLIGSILQQLTGVPYTTLDRIGDFLLNLVPGAGQADTARKLARIGQTIDSIVDAARLADKLPPGVVGRADALGREIGRAWTQFQEQVVAGRFDAASVTWGSLIGKIRELQVASRISDNGGTLVDINRQMRLPGGRSVELDVIFDEGGRRIVGEVKTGGDVMLRAGSDRFQSTLGRFIEKRDVAAGMGAGFRVYADDISADMLSALRNAGIDVVRNGTLLR